MIKKLEKAVQLLTKHFHPDDENSRKPVLPHDIRVAAYLSENDYSDEVVLAGLLHDAIEWSDLTEQILRDAFGDKVVKLVLACTKDDSIKDSDEKIEELIKRCARNGQDALIVKTADILDSYEHYTKTNNKDELEYCRKNAGAILEYKPENFDDPIFNKLKKLYE